MKMKATISWPDCTSPRYMFQSFSFSLRPGTGPLSTSHKHNIHPTHVKAEAISCVSTIFNISHQLLLASPSTSSPSTRHHFHHPNMTKPSVVRLHTASSHPMRSSLTPLPFISPGSVSCLLSVYFRLSHSFTLRASKLERIGRVCLLLKRDYDLCVMVV
jgi:hypothetical protein